MLRALRCAVSGGGQGAITCDRCPTDVRSLRCTSIHRRTAPAGPVWPCEWVRAPSMPRCSPSSSVRRRGPAVGSGQGHAFIPEHCAHLFVPAGVAKDTVLHSLQRWQACGRSEARDQGSWQLGRGHPTRSGEGPRTPAGGRRRGAGSPSERLVSDRLPCVIREYPMVVEGRCEVIPLRAVVSLGGRHTGVTPGEVAHKSLPPASICSTPGEEGKGGAVRDRLPTHF